MIERLRILQRVTRHRSPFFRKDSGRRMRRVSRQRTEQVDSMHLLGTRSYGISGWWISAIALCAVLWVGGGETAEAATSGTADVNLEAAATATITIVDASITLSPGQADYEAGYIVAEGAAGIAVQVQTNSSTGMVLSVKCSDGTPEIALADLLFKTQTAAGGSGTTQAAYTAITAVDQTLWTTTDVQETAFTVDTDIRINNLWTYPDPGDDGGAKTTYTDQLTYTVAIQ